MSASNHFRANLALLVCSVIWGATFVVVRNALADSSVMAFLAARFLIATAILLVVYRRHLREFNWQTFRAGSFIGLLMFGGYVFQTVGLKFTTPSKAALITGSSVILVPLFLAACGLQRITRWVWCGAVSAFTGLYFLTVGPRGLGSLNRGDPLVFGCAVLFALQLIFIGRAMSRYSVAAISLLEVGTTALVALALVPAVAAAGAEPTRFALTHSLQFALAMTAIGATALCLPLQIWAQQYASPSHAAILLSLEPVFAALTSYLTEDEKLGARELLGAALVLAGILLAERKEKSPPGRPLR